ncbi:hypothetical protein G7046_g3383 [Stylonectria norvegica]|nr:hypothetical protein G7046_g3383 [Stylonectria norvegica]
MNLPEKQTCAWVQQPGPGAVIEFREIEVPTPGPGEVLVKLEVSGVCHSDHHSIFGNTPMTTHIAGHEGVGTVVAEYCVADANYVCKIPDTVPAAIAAPLLCGGITMYSALVKADLAPGDFVVIPGAGGGLGHLGVQIATSMGYQVIAIDSGWEKEAVCNKSGAKVFLDFREGALVQRVKDATNGIGAHAVICITGAPSAYDSALDMLRNCGKLLCVGIPPSSYRLQIDPFQMLVRGLRVIGSSVGNKAQMGILMDMVLEGKLKPEIQVMDFHALGAVMDRLETGSIAGRAVLKIPQ